ncbi:MAG: serine hydrolase [Mycobacteriaceae bacterium]|nr:serine hydrolase [Mycobacteriaceae bacterium]
MTNRAAGAVLGLVLLALVGCTQTHRVSAPPLLEGPPNEFSGLQIPSGAVKEAVSKLDGLVAELMNNSGVPGLAVAVVYGGKTLYAKGFGVKDIRQGDAAGNRVGADTVFQLASISKSLGATVVAHEATDHVIGWDTPVATKLPWLALSDPYVSDHVTIADLYSHRSGLPDHAGDRLESLGYERGEVLARLKYLPLSPFRISYAYSNFGLTAAAQAVATAAGKAWEDLAEQVLYGPLGMTSTSSTYAGFAGRADHAVNHVKVADHYEARYQRDPDAQSPAGGASSSVNDMAHWLNMLLANGVYNGRRIAAPEDLLPINTPQVIALPASTPQARAGFYGHGFTVSVTSSGRTQYGHSGAFASGAATTFAVLPSADVGIVVLTNAAPIGVPETLTAEFLDLVQYGQIREDWAGRYRQAFAPMLRPQGALVGQPPPTEPAPARPLNTYVGQYANAYWGLATVRERDGQLQLSLGPSNVTFDLTHWDGDTFTFPVSNPALVENAPPGTLSKATFTANSLTCEYFNTEGLGTFTR